MFRSSSSIQNLSRGFTLIELMVATSILVLVVVAVVTTYRVGIGAWQKGEETIDSLYGARLALELMTGDLRATFLPPLDLSDPSEPKAPKIIFRGRPSELEFTTSIDNPDLSIEPKEGDLIKVRYLLEEGELKRAIGEQEPLILATGIKEISFSYHNGQTYQDFWDSDELLPKGVKIEIELNDGRRLQTMVWIPTS